MQIAYVPTKVYFPGVATAASTLATCAELVLPADAPLAWTGAPVLDAASAPPPPASANAPLRIRSPPPFDSVAAHLSLVGTAGGEGTLACWPFPDHTPAEACQRVLSYFESEGLTERQLQRLQGVALVPVSNGARLVAPSALFLRTPVDMRPLAYELPPSFVSGLPVLKQLGLKDAPSNADLLAILGALPGARRLTTPQLTAVGRLLHHLLVESSAPEALAAASRGHITVPTALGILVPPHACIWADASLWDVVPRLSGTQINVVHPLVSPAVCKALGIASLADVMEEKLDASHDEAPVSAIQGVTPDDLSARLRDPSVAAAVHAALLAQQRWAVAAETKSYSSAGPKTLEEVAHALAQVAAGLRFVQTCHTVLQLSSKGASRVLEGSASQVACHAEPGCLVLAAEPAAAFSAAVAAAVSKLLRAPSLLPIAPLFEAPADLLAATARIISGVDGSSRAATTANNTAITSSTLTAAAAAGQLGAVLTPGDSAAARLLPLRRYAAGELVALRMPTGQLRYARIAADSGPLPGMAAYKATIEISPGKFRDILSSEIMALGSAGEEEDATGMPGSQAEVNSAIESVDSAGDVRGRASVPEKVAAGEDVAGASPAEIAGALRSMLTAAGLPLDPNSAELLEQTLTLRQRLQSTEGQLAAAATERAKAEEAAAEMRTAWQCRICLQREVNTVSVACGHLLCNVCAAALPRPACPFCRKTSQMQRLYR